MLTTFITPRLSTILPQVKAFMESEIYPIDNQLVYMKDKDRLPVIERLRQKVKENGWFTPQFEAHHGGMGLTVLEFALMSELLGSSPVGHWVFNAQAPDAGNMELLGLFGNLHQQETYLRPLVRGEIRSCFAMTEPHFAGSNPTRLSTTAVREGDEYVINGHKWFTTGADGAAFSIVMAITNPEAPEHQRASMIIVPLATAGFELVRNIPIMGEAGEGWFSHGEVKFHNCRVPVENLIGTEGEGFKLAQVRLGAGRIHHCMRWIGICERVFSMMCERAASRSLNDFEQLGNKQIIQAWIAEERANIDAARLLVLNAAEKMEREGAKAAKIEISTIKFFCSKILHDLLHRAIQVHGGLGVTDDLLPSFWYRHERGASIYDGADEVHKSVVARHILKQYGLNIR